MKLNLPKATAAGRQHQGDETEGDHQFLDGYAWRRRAYRDLAQ